MKFSLEQKLNSCILFFYISKADDSPYFSFDCTHMLKKKDVAGESSCEKPIEIFKILTELLRFFIFVLIWIS